MSVLTSRLSARRRADLAQFIRFCVVGAAGFLVDAAVLTVATRRAGMDPYTGRLVSVAVAIVATFVLNRHWAFRAADHRAFWPAFAGYIGVQGVGFLCNFGIYSLLCLVLPAPFNAPLLCLAVASAAALFVNFAGARLFVFRTRRA